MKNRHTNPVRSHGAVILFALLLCLAVIKVYPFLSSGPLRFKPKTWAEHPSLRERMLDNLLEQYPLIGMEKAEIDTLLGPGNQAKYTDSLYIVSYGVRYDYIGDLVYGGTFTLFYNNDDICNGYQLPYSLESS